MTNPHRWHRLIPMAVPLAYVEGMGYDSPKSQQGVLTQNFPERRRMARAVPLKIVRGGDKRGRRAPVPPPQTQYRACPKPFEMLSNH